MENYDSVSYKTTDLALAAALITIGFSVSKLERIGNGKKTAFVFISNGKLNTAVEDYWNDNIKVSPKSYFDALKHLKTRIYTETALW